MTPQPLDHLLHLLKEETSHNLQPVWGIASFCGTLTNFRYYYSIKYTISTALCTRAFSSAQRRSVEGTNNRLFVYGNDICIPVAVINAESSRVFERIIIHEWALTYDSHNQSPFMMEIFKMSPIEDDSSVHLMEEERIVRTLFPVETHDTPPIFKRPYARLNVDRFEESCPQTALTTKKRKRDTHKYIVFGRITCLSSISIQREANCTHYFIEIEHQDMERGEQNLVNVMMIGSLSIQLHVCMVPGRFIFLTEAVKVFSLECQTFLLQSKNEISDSGYRIYLWDQSLVIPTNVLPWSIDITTKKELIGSEAYKTWKTGSLLTYEGQVTDFRWNQCLQLDSSSKISSGVGDFSVWLLLYHYPNFNELSKLRIGARLRVYNAHLVDKPRSEEEHWAIGACVRSHITIIKFASFEHSAVVDSISLTRNEVPGPPVSLSSEFGAIQHQPLPITFWLTSLFRLLTQQFNFDSAKHARLRSMYHFPMLKRRQLTMRMVEAFSPQLYSFLTKKLTRSTLGSMFLNPDHERIPTECYSIKLPLALQDVVKQRCMMISQITTVASEIMADNVYSLEKHLKDCFIIGRLSGTIGNGDLTLSDQNSRIAVTLSEAIDSLKEEKIHWAKHYTPNNFTDALYIIRNVRVRVCQHTAITKPLPKEFRRAYSLLIAWKDLVPVHVAAPKTNQPSSIGITDRIPKVMMFVTSIYPIDTTASWSLPGIRDYQLIRGILTHSSIHSKTLRFVQVLLPVLRVPWLIKPGRSYIITNVQKKVNAISDLIALGYKRLHVASLQPSETRLIDTIRRFCKLLAAQVEHREEKLNKELLAFVLSHTNQIDTPCEHRYDTFYGQSDSAVDLSESKCGIERLNSFCPTDLADNEMLKWLRNPTGTSFSWKKCKHTTVQTSVFLHILPALFRDSLSIATPHGLSRFQIEQFKAHSEEESIVLEPALHQPHLRSVAGRIKFIRVSQRSLPSKSVMFSSVAERIITCHLQDFESLEIVEVHINLSKFGFHGGFHMGLNVIFMNLETYVARSTYKVYLNWGQYSSIQQLGQRKTPFPTSNENMKASNLLQLYLESHLIDRTWHRWAARVVHINYFVLKRRCRSCHAELSLENIVHCEWQHPQNARSPCPLQHHYPYREHRQLDREIFLGDVSYVNTCIRGLIDDGSAQAEVFAENQTAWDLLRASESQRRYFEGVMTQKMSKLGYFFSASAQSNAPPSHLLSSKIIQEDLGKGFSAEYFEKQLSGIIRLCVSQNRRPVIIIGQRFYSKKNQRKENSHDGDCTSVVSFGADLRLTTKTRPVIRVEAKSVDPLQLKAESRRLLVAFEE